MIAKRGLTVEDRKGVTTEITDQKQTEMMLHLFEKAVETMQLGLTITNEEGKILYTNPAEAGMHGYQVGELIGQNVRILAPREIWNPMTVEQLKAMNRWKRESTNIRKDGSIFLVQLMSVVVTDIVGNTLVPGIWNFWIKKSL
jgi:PAS domain S-box-containing protein